MHALLCQTSQSRCRLGCDMFRASSMLLLWWLWSSSCYRDGYRSALAVKGKAHASLTCSFNVASSAHHSLSSCTNFRRVKDLIQTTCFCPPAFLHGWSCRATIRLQSDAQTIVPFFYFDVLQSNRALERWHIGLSLFSNSNN